MTLISFDEYAKLPKGKLVKHTFKEKTATQTTKVVNKRKKGTRLTAKPKKNQTKKESPKKVEGNFVPGAEYYIEDSTRRKNEFKEIYKGKFVKTRTTENNEVYVYFNNVEKIVAPFGGRASPVGFSSRGHRFIEVK